jgi:hypothetical protein
MRGLLIYETGNKELHQHPEPSAAFYYHILPTGGKGACQSEGEMAVQIAPGGLHVAALRALSRT